MKESALILFDRLKDAVARRFLKENPASSKDYKHWKGDDIARFQEDLLQKVKGRVSEKWFYTYFKNTPDKLPRIDILNLLSAYAGYQNWADFKQKNLKASVKQNPKKNRFLIKSLFLSLIVLASGFYLMRPAKKQVRFCLNSLTSETDEQIHVSLILPDESEKNLTLNNHCVVFSTGLDEVQLRITSPYYVDKLIKRKIPYSDYTETIDLHPDLIALLLQHYSQSDTNDWQKRRKRLQKFIADSAMIFQQLPQKEGIELFDKQEFIDQLCIPTGWLRNMEILEIVYRNSKIIKLRFRIKKD